MIICVYYSGYELIQHNENIIENKINIIHIPNDENIFLRNKIFHVLKFKEYSLRNHPVKFSINIY